ncbi:MAG: YqaE/Pmp3 family membrane protein [Chitinophagales bacterium]
MKKHKLVLAVFSLAILFSSCSRQYDLHFAGHYKPNTDLTTKEHANAITARQEKIQPLATPSTDLSASASIDQSSPDLKLLNPSIQKTLITSPLSDKQQRSVGKVTQKIEKQIEKNNSKIETLQKKSLSSDNDQKAVQKSLDDDNKALYAILGFLIPPLGVGLYEGKITAHFWIALLLMLCFWLPGAIYALIIILG